MNDDQLGRELRAALLKDDPGAVPARLSGRVASVPDEAAARRGAGSLRFSRVSPMLRALEAIAAVVVVGALVAATLYLRGSSVGQVAGSSSSVGVTGTASGEPSTGTPAPSKSATSTTPTTAPTPTPTAQAKQWTGLKWSARSTIPDASSIDDIVAWNGTYIAAGRAGLVNSSGGQLPVGIWRSSDGTSWTPVSLDAAMFFNANIAGLVGTPTGLVAWGTAGDPTCSGEGEGMTCGAIPVMLWTSPNGTDWSRVSGLAAFKDARIGNIAYGSLGLLAVGNTGFTEPAIWTSTTGASWQRLTLPTDVFTDAHLSTISATASGYVVGGSTGGTAPTSGGVALEATSVAAAWWSDGQTWNKATVNRTGGIGTSLDAIYVGANGMVGIGSASGGKAGTAWNSSDGKTWQPIDGAPSAATLAWYTVGGDGTRLVALGTGDKGQLVISVSEDSVTWKTLLSSGSTATALGWARAYVVPDGVIVIDSSGPSSTAQTPVWMATAQ